jgi:RNA polymerase sigma-70 factor (sigma-E family)
VTSEQAFVELATARGPALFRTAWLLTGDFHLAEDLVQEALGRIYARWSKVAAADQPAAYAHTVLVHVFLSQRRRRSSTERPSDASLLDGMGDRPGADDDVPLRVALRDALAHLDRTDRAVVVLRYWDDLDAPTTGALVGLSPAAVRTRCSRALTRLRDVLGDDLAELLAR